MCAYACKREGEKSEKRTEDTEARSEREEVKENREETRDDRELRNICFPCKEFHKQGCKPSLHPRSYQVTCSSWKPLRARPSLAGRPLLLRRSLPLVPLPLLRPSPNASFPPWRSPRTKYASGRTAPSSVFLLVLPTRDSPRTLSFHTTAITLRPFTHHPPTHPHLFHPLPSYPSSPNRLSPEPSPTEIFPTQNAFHPNYLSPDQSLRAELSLFPGPRLCLPRPRPRPPPPVTPAAGMVTDVAN